MLEGVVFSWLLKVCLVVAVEVLCVISFALKAA
jgi:hypothetical protein